MRDIKDILLEYLENKVNPTLVLKENVEVSDALKYHIDNNMGLTNNIFRVYSESYFNLVNEVRSLYEKGLIGLNEEDSLMVESNLGEYIIVEGEKIYLDAPFEETEVESLDEVKQ
jgi:hypothetical protein